MFTQETASENVENKNYGSPINPSEMAPDTKPPSPSAEGTQVMANLWKDVGFGEDFGIAGFIYPGWTRETPIGS